MTNRRNTKLTAEKVYQARVRWYARKATAEELALEAGVSIGCMRNALKGLTWQNVRMVESAEEIEHQAAESMRRFALFEEEGVNEGVSLLGKILDKQPPPAPSPSEQLDVRQLMIVPCTCKLVRAPRHKFPRTFEGTIHCLDKPCYQEENSNAADPT